MYEIDPKFFNEDGTLNLDKAMTAGQRARNQVAGQSFSAIRESSKHGTGAGYSLIAAISGWCSPAKTTA